MKKKIKALRWIIWSLAVFYYFYEYIIRVMPSVMASELMASFNIQGAGFGALSAAYMYSYAPMQVPVGILMDRYGARRLLTIGAFLCGSGSLLFAASPILFVSEMGRFLTGIGSAFGFVGFIYICNHWFHEKNATLMMGIGNSLGMLGAVAGLGPITYLVNSLGWRGASTSIGFAGIALAIVILLLVRNEPKGMGKIDAKPPMSEVLRNFKDVIANRQTWVIALLSALMYLPTSSFAGLWCAPYIQTLYNVDNKIAGYASSMIFVGWILGCPMIGHYSDIICRRKPFYIVNSILILIVLSFIIYYPPSQIYEMFILLVLLGVLISVQLLTYSSAIELNNPEAKGSAIAVANFTVFMGACIAQPLVGWLLDWHWTGAEQHGIPVFTISNYQFALSIFPIAMILSFLIAIFLKEEHRYDVSDYVGE